MKNTQEHTPTPEELAKLPTPFTLTNRTSTITGNPIIVIRDSNEDFIADVSPSRPLSAALIVKAVNAHDELIAALRRIVDAHRSGNNGLVCGEAVICESMALQAERALAKAEGK